MDFSDRVGGGGEEREKHGHERNTSSSCLQHWPQSGPGIESAAEVHALNRDSKLWSEG